MLQPPSGSSGKHWLGRTRSIRAPITVDKNAAYPKAVADIKKDKQLWRFSKLRRDC